MTTVMDDPDEIAAALRGTALDGCPVEEGLGGTWVVTGIDQSQLLPDWRAARSATSVTGRWPVLTGVDESGRTRSARRSRRWSGRPGRWIRGRSTAGGAPIR